MRLMKFISVVIILAIVPTFAVAPSAAAQTQTTVKHVPITNTSSASGKEMFESYCAVCHGKAAKGDGPAAAALKTPPSDLTVLAQKNGGKFPAVHVSAVIRGQAPLASHGTQDMPVWGPLFSSISQGHEAQVQQRISNLTDYVEKLQAN